MCVYGVSDSACMERFLKHTILKYSIGYVPLPRTKLDFAELEAKSPVKVRTIYKVTIVL